tara:strand:- start:170 stop:934 length:765 start_codon:yes stop_codon:yes gene_type:complete
VFVVTKNEEKNLERCLSSISGLAEEIIIVDSGSTDGTQAIAERHHAQWHHQDWLGFRDQKRVALGYCTKPWVLLLDSDEEVSADLRPELIAFFDGDHESYDGAEFARRTWFLGRWILHGDWYPDRKLRLFRRDRVTIGGAPEHEVAEVPGAVKRMSGDLNHYSFPTMNSYVRKIIVFSDAFLEREIDQNRKWSLARNLSRPAWRFFRGYFIRLGFLDGFPGLWIATATFFLSFVRYSRTYEHERNCEPESMPQN